MRHRIGGKLALTTLHWALLVSLSLHGALLGLRLVDPERFNRVFRDTPLEVILVNAHSSEPPTKAQALAQKSLAGGGTQDKGRAQSPLPAHATAELGDAPDDARRRIEQLGVIAVVNGVVGNNTSRKLDVSEFRGFALADAYAPVVFVNGADGKAAQVFTLAHELAHLWLGATGLSDLEPVSVRDNTVERWCNRVAAELLVPMDEFRELIGASADVRSQLQSLAEHFRVSTQVVLGRFREAGRLTWDQYLHEMAVERARVAAIVAERGSGGNYYNTKPVQIGKRFARALVASALEGQTSYTEAFRLLGLKKASTFDGLADRLGVR